MHISEIMISFHAFVCLSYFSQIGALTISEYTRPSDCPEGMFYDISHLKCEDCPGENTAPSSDKLTCACKDGFRRVTDYGGIDTKCEACPTGQVPSPDGWTCTGCVRPFTGTRNETAKQSNSCPDTCDVGGRSSSISLSRNATGFAYSNNTCASCQSNTVIATLPKSGIQYCEPCNPSPEGGTCPCSGEQSGGLCFSRGSLVASLTDTYTVIYEPNNERIVSAYFQEHLRAADYMCKTHKNFTACQLLGNLCVLLHYANQDSTRSTRGDTACDYYNNIASANSVPNPWPAWMPFLTYTQDDNSAVLTKSDFDVALSFAPEDPMSVMNFTAAVYALNGSFVDLVPLTGGLLQLCAAEMPVLDSAYRFGRKYRQTCQVSLQELIAQQDVLFFDIYLTYPSRQQGKSAMYPIPVLNLNFVNSETRVNTLADRGRWQFFRRIFLSDSIISKERESSSGGAAANPTGTIAGNQGPKFLRYAQYIGIFVKLKDTKDGRIFPPFIRIQYADIKLDGHDPKETVPVEFEVSYSMDTSRHEKDLEITMSTLCSFGALWALLKAWSWSRRSGKAAVDFATIFKFLIFLAATISNIFLIVLVFMCAWMLILYKRQRTPVMMMLTPEQEYSFLVYLGMAMALKTIELINLVAEQVTAKVFFIDWERPRGYIIPRAGESNPDQPPTDVVGADPGPGKTLSPVTIWRTYIVANEWNEFQVYRKTSYVLQLFAMIFFLKIVNLENLALIEPGATIWNPPKEYQDSRMSRFAVASVTYLLFGFFQWFVNVFIVERCIVDHFRTFMDLCSISNVSVMVLQYHQFGYYIHGRSVHGHADTNMREMNEMLQRERENMCTQRGLEPNTEHQCFIASFSHKFRDQYDRMIGALQSPNRPESRMSPANQTTAQVERQIDVYAQLNQFLSAFIEHLLPDTSYIVKDRLFLESVLDMEFLDSSQKATFHRDPSDAAFARVFFYGNEWTLLTFDMLTFCIVDLIAHNFLIAAFVTYLISTVIRRFRSLGGKKNIVKTCLIDERFLI